MKYIKVSQPFPFVLHVELARGPVNAFTTEFWTEYGAVFDRVSEGEYGDVRAVVLSSVLEKIFSAGIDFQGLSFDSQSSADPARTANVLRKRLLAFQHAISAPERCPVPVIAAVHGVAYGLAIDIIAACDVRYAAVGATFSVKEVDVGLAADIGTLARLPKITGNQSLARELAYTARTFSSAEAEKLGLVSRVIGAAEGRPGSERETVVDAALNLAKEIASKSPVAVRGTKHLLLHSRDHGVPENLEYTATWNSAMLQTSDMSQAVRAAKSKSREAPTFSAVLPASTKSKL
ncbi:ClpP/crotonase [Paxillus ammoniavirescens]|nr:ClpP/crotonase [Paxillus ammoniavirescens]